jgi:hypothetical protein
MLKFLIIISLLVLALQNCKRNPNGGKTVEVNINLSVEETGVTESWLKIEIDHPAAVKSVSLLRNDSTVTQFSAQKDTLLMDENLEPNRTYVYQVSLLLSDGEKQKSAKAETLTMDTTSHNFTWETFEFGGGSYSCFSDVAIISPDNIWAVGEIHTEDTDQWNEDSTEWIDSYNAAHWDGDKWELKRITVNFRGSLITPPLDGVFAFSPTDIWFVGSLPIYGDGVDWEIFDVRQITGSDLSLTKMWGTSSNDMYFIGRSGSIAHYNGLNWRKISSGTDLDFYSIYGDYNDQTNSWEVIALASDIFHSRERVIIKIENSRALPISSYPMSWSMSGLWFIANKKYYVTGNGIYQKKNLEEESWKELMNFSPYYIYEILGTGLNDIFTLGACQEIMHFNGLTWSRVRPISCEGSYAGISIQDNIIAIAGSYRGKGTILVGNR